jgi:hypothetical protein
VIVGGVINRRQADLPEIGRALHQLRLPPGTGEGREQDGKQKAYDSNNNQQLHECKPVSISVVTT